MNQQSHLVSELALLMDNENGEDENLQIVEEEEGRVKVPEKNEKLLSMDVEDYHCSICMSLAVPPVRLDCGHLYCGLCHIKYYLATFIPQVVKTRAKIQSFYLDCTLCRTQHSWDKWLYAKIDGIAKRELQVICGEDNYEELEDKNAKFLKIQQAMFGSLDLDLYNNKAFTLRNPHHLLQFLYLYVLPPVLNEASLISQVVLLIALIYFLTKSIGIYHSISAAYDWGGVAILLPITTLLIAIIRIPIFFSNLCEVLEQRRKNFVTMTIHSINSGEMIVDSHMSQWLGIKFV